MTAVLVIALRVGLVVMPVRRETEKPFLRLVLGGKK